MQAGRHLSVNVRMPHAAAHSEMNPFINWSELLSGNAFLECHQSSDMADIRPKLATLSTRP